jgi:hypothetical protein
LEKISIHIGASEAPHNNCPVASPNEDGIPGHTPKSNANIKMFKHDLRNISLSSAHKARYSSHLGDIGGFGGRSGFLLERLVTSMCSFWLVSTSSFIRILSSFQISTKAS